LLLNIIIRYLNKSKNILKLGGDSLLKIITGLIIIKMITNVNDDALLANFSQLKMFTALLISVSSSIFILGLNKLSLKNKDSLYVGGTFLIVFLICMLVCGGVFVFNDEIQKLVGRQTNLFYALLLVLIVCGFISNYLIGCKVSANENESIANGKLCSTASSFLIFLTLYYCNVGVWLSLFFYLISYYLCLSFFLFNKVYFYFLRERVKLTKVLCADLFSIYSLTLVSAIIFPSCILFFRYHLSVYESWEVVSIWEAEWQLSTLILLVLSPVLSIILTTFFTEKLKKSEITRLLLVKTILIFVVFTMSFTVLIYLSRGLLISFLFNAEMLNASNTSSFFTLLMVNFFRLITVVVFYILYVIIDTRKLIYSEIIFGFVFISAFFVDVGRLGNMDIHILLPTLASFIYLLVLLLKTDEFKNK
jgi:hypothetical protein